MKRNNLPVETMLSSTANKGTSAKNIKTVSEDVGQPTHNNKEPTKTRMTFEYLYKKWFFVKLWVAPV